MALAGEYDFTQYQGDTWDESWVIEDDGTPRDLTGYSCRMYLKVLVTDPDPPVLAMTSVNSKLVITTATGTITMACSPTVTDAVSAGEYVYDFELVDGSGKVKKYMAGKFTVIPQVTTGT